MIKSAARIAVGVAVGVMIGGCVVPRLMLRELYGDSWPPIWKQSLLYLITGFIAAFAVAILIFRIKEHFKKPAAPLGTGSVVARELFVSELPADIDWQQLNDFLRETGFDRQLLLDNWRGSEAFAAYPVSDTTLDCLSCLHEDLAGCYKGIFVFDENGMEDRTEEYRLLREKLFSKYAKIDEGTLDSIYYSYLTDDR